MSRIKLLTLLVLLSQAFFCQTKDPKDDGRTIKIPVVVHVLRPNPSEIPDTMIQRELDELITDYIAAASSPGAANPNIEFYLKDTKWVKRKWYNRGLQKKSPLVDPERCLNVYITRRKSTSATDGNWVRIKYTDVGKRKHALTHEAGHWLGLNNIGGRTHRCNWLKTFFFRADGIDDTRFQWFYGSRSNNFMGHSRNRVMFTNGQAIEIRNNIINLRPKIYNRTPQPPWINEHRLFYEYFLKHAVDSIGYANTAYANIKSNWQKRTELLNALEDYLFVFKSSLIAPMFLAPESTCEAHYCRCKTANKPDLRSAPEFRKNYDSIDSTGQLKPKSERRNTQQIRAQVQNGYETDILILLFDLCGLLREEDAPFVSKNISEVRRPFTLEYIYNHYKETFVDPCYTASDYKGCLARGIYEQNLSLLSERIDLRDKLSYCYYEGTHGKANMIKGFEAHHDNDVFMLIPGKNQDRELTGAFRFSFATDYMKWRFFRFSEKPENVLSYQSISVGGYGYTPYIRYRNNTGLADTLHSNDRPFGSYMYLERAKYRTWRKGVLRQRGELQVGFIGISQGRNIQAQLHEDVIYDSQFVYGWDNQIGSGGRLALQINEKADFMIWSNTNRYSSIFSPKTIAVEDKKRYAGINFIGEIDLRFGGFQTSAGAGIRFSTLDFLKQSGTQQIMLRRPGHKREFGWKFDAGFSYRYVVHNTMLEGLGYTKTFPYDRYDVVKEDHYVLPYNQIERHLLVIDCGINFRFRKTTVYFRQTFHTLEYKTNLSTFDYGNSSVLTTIKDPDDIPYYNNTIVKENKSFADSRWFGGKTYYGYGALGVSWVIE